MSDYWSMSDEDLEDMAIKYQFSGYWISTGQSTIIDRQAIINQLLIRDAAFSKQTPQENPNPRKIGF
jgi:hypothetical protein